MASPNELIVGGAAVTVVAAACIALGATPNAGSAHSVVMAIGVVERRPLLPHVRYVIMHTLVVRVAASLRDCRPVLTLRG